MKKFLITAALFMTCIYGVPMFLSASGQSQASLRAVPTGPGNSLQNSDYGGVDWSTITFSSNLTFMFKGEGSAVGFIASSGTNISDYLIFCDTPTATSNDTTTEFTRVYITSGTSTQNTGVPPVTGLGMSYTFPKPIHVTRGLSVKPSVATYNVITVLFTRFTQ